MICAWTSVLLWRTVPNFPRLTFGGHSKRIFRAEQGISCAEQGVCSVSGCSVSGCSVSGQFHRIALQLHDQDGVASPGVAGVSPNPVHRAVTDGPPFQRQLALANAGDERSTMLQPP